MSPFNINELCQPEQEDPLAFSHHHLKKPAICFEIYVNSSLNEFQGANDTLHLINVGVASIIFYLPLYVIMCILELALMPFCCSKFS